MLPRRAIHMPEAEAEGPHVREVDWTAGWAKKSVGDGCAKGFQQNDLANFPDKIAAAQITKDLNHGVYVNRHDND